MTSANLILSTYNGAPFLASQLDSLLGQTVLPTKLTIRDDGSSDQTVAVLETYRQRFPHVQMECGENLGVYRSFFRALQTASQDSDYYAFCDQDDVWRPNKLQRAIAHLASLPQDTPLLYCSRIEYVDAELNHIDYLPIPRELSLQNALVQNVVIGCTVVINRAARDLILSRLPERVIMHDWWFYLVISALGQIVYDPVASIQYRQHGGNVVGGTTNPAVQMLQRFKRQLVRTPNAFRVSDQARALLECHGAAMRPGDRQLVEDFVHSRESLASRLAYLAHMPVRRQTRLDDWSLRAMILLGRY